MTPLATGIDYVDLEFLGYPNIIATAVLHGTSGVALVDPGPSTSLEALGRALAARGIDVADVRQILLTHIHLDHAGATGSLVEQNPAIEVFVHARGAPHLSDPSRLLASASRLYGQDMDTLWGAVLPVPAARLRVLQGGERLVAGGRELDVAYTPGHASHHVSYFEPASGIAFIGDTAGIRRGSGVHVMPAAPPPDIDLEAWRASETLILAWEPDTLFLTHFGPFHGARQHFAQLMDRLAAWNRAVRRLLLDTSLTEEQRQTRFVHETTQEMRRAVGDVEAEQYSRAGSIAYSWQGLARYWRKHTAQAGEGGGTSIDGN
jgi:glyoxylase-like metal-dependent hydrolase (beta-lactamase superfamily II)